MHFFENEDAQIAPVFSRVDLDGTLIETSIEAPAVMAREIVERAGLYFRLWRPKLRIPGACNEI